MARQVKEDKGMMKVECVGGPRCGEFIELGMGGLECRMERGIEMAYWCVEEPTERTPVYVWHRGNTPPDVGDWFPHAY